jgi:Family of unknown function (DUF6516)
LHDVANLTTVPYVGILANVEAKLVTRYRDVAEDGTGIEFVVWKLPAPVAPSTHGYKYRLVYLVRGRRVIGFDNERGKGDHCHIGNEERPYAFGGVDKLLKDFFIEVDRWKAGR